MRVTLKCKVSGVILEMSEIKNYGTNKKKAISVYSIEFYTIFRITKVILPGVTGVIYTNER